MAFTGNWACNTLRTGLASSVFNFGAGTPQTFKIALYNNSATLNNLTTGYTSTGEVSATGYTAGGMVLPINQTPTTTNGAQVAFWSFANVTWTAAMTVRGALIYLFDGATNPAVCVLDFGSDKTSSTSFTVQFPPATTTSAILRIA